MTPRSERIAVDSGTTRQEVVLRRTTGSADAGQVDVEVEINDRRTTARVTAVDAITYAVVVDGRRIMVRIGMQGSRGWAMADGATFDLDRAAADADPDPAALGPDPLSTPMPATVTAVVVQPGDTVERGDTVVRLEAMKMELSIRAPQDGRVVSVDCAVGELVQPGRPLITLGPAPAGGNQQARA